MTTYSFNPSLTIFASFLLALGLTACDSAMPDLTQESALASAAKPTIVEFPGDNPGPPFYANFNASFIPTADGRVGILFVRDPSCIPPNFDLLSWFDPPAAFGCDLTIEGKLWYDDPATDPFPYTVQHWGSEVPVYFVDRAELDEGLSGGLTIGELQGMESLLIGTAERYRQVIHNSNHGASFGHEGLTASGTLEDGRAFKFRYNERFDPATSERTFWAVRIEIK